MQELDQGEDIARYRFLLQHLDDVLATIDSRGVILQLSKGSYRLLGYYQSELLERNLFSLLHEEDVETVGAMLAGSLEDEMILVRLRQRLGHYIWAEIRYQRRAQRDEVLLLICDVTERQELEQQLGEEQGEFGFLNDSVTDLVARLTLDGHIVFVSPAAAVLLDYAPEQLRDRSVYELVHPEDRQLFRWLLERVQKAPEMKKVTYRIQHQLGHYVWFETRARMVDDGNGESAPSIICTSRDITQFKQAQMRIRQQTEQVMLLEELGRMITSTLDLDQVLDLVLAKLNPILAAETMALLLRDGDDLLFASVRGSDTEKLRGKRLPVSLGPVAELLQRRDARLVGDMWIEAHNIDLSAFELTQVRDWRSFVVMPLRIGERAIGLIAAAHRRPNAFDYNDANLLEVVAHWSSIAVYNARLFERLETRGIQLQRLTQKLVFVQEAERERLSREIHDRTGQELTVLRIQLMLLREQIAPTMPEEAVQLDESLQLLRGTMEHMSSLAQLLRPPALDTIGLHSALTSLCHRFGKASDLNVQYSGAEGLLTGSAEITIYRFVQEMLSNVVRHAEATEVNITMRPALDAVIVSVSDNGKGFAPQVMARFHTSSGPMGLFAMRERIELLGGRLDVESSPDAGTTITAIVPAKEQL